MARPDVESVSGSLIHLAELPVEGLSEVELPVAGELQSVLLRRVGARVQAWLNICPHAGRRMDYAPGKFLLDQGRLVCAAHGASFELEQGVCVAGPCRGASLVPLVVVIG
ncbi:MAG: Rieske (2Fe-2S) protein [Arenimonas sp.]|uniref:Rieske (2Fe-2S) protein n=1 Tax=Arenimonas sp. TaxID=1872635 RepID=UPI0025BB8BF7|nr:Rieske (2Fe-2S) protein [Arenimonas sp.]MBW8367653.1 Rieske (2Fe-2S) protein [Arenimonas sp.]